MDLPVGRRVGSWAGSGSWGTSTASHPGWPHQTGQYKGQGAPSLSPWIQDRHQHSPAVMNHIAFEELNSIRITQTTLIIINLFHFIPSCVPKEIISAVIIHIHKLSYSLVKSWDFLCSWDRNDIDFTKLLNQKIDIGIRSIPPLAVKSNAKHWSITTQSNHFTSSKWYY